jgi:PIN domain nuclease of toxin-antitoxin system
MGLDPERLGAKTRKLLSDSATELFLSAAGAWEIVVKATRGKLALPIDAATYIRTRLRTSQTLILPISLDHILTLATLPERHRDPFDRIMLAQAASESVPFVTADDVLLKYAIKTIDARK